MSSLRQIDDLTDEVFQGIARMVYQHARITLGDNKRELVRARLGKVIRERGFSGFREYYEWMRADKTGEALRELMNSISTNLTSFFRENKHFEYLAKEFLPALDKKGQRRLRGWSAGCSTGEEVYTTAITICETLPELASWDIKLLATDIDTEVVQHGTRGVYLEERFRDVPVSVRNKYFTACVDEKGKPSYQAKEGLRRMVSFRHLNLFSPWPMKGTFDFIFCRNVMIYFDRPTQEQLVNRYYEQLSIGGLLFIGHSESLSAIKHPFEYVLPTIYRRGAQPAKN